MREIKFRYWDLEYKHWVELPCLIGDYQANSYRTYGDPFPLSSFMHGEYQERLKDGLLVIQQYTGVKDKNGKEIYEGDIVNGEIWINDPNGKSGFAKITNRKVYFKSGAFMVEIRDYIHNVYKIELMGNIFENPELLES